MYPDSEAGAAGQPPRVTAGRPGPAAWWYLLPVGLLLLSCLLAGAVALMPAKSGRPATPIGEGEPARFSVVAGRGYWLFHSAERSDVGRDCRFTNGANVRIGGRTNLLSPPPKEVSHGGRTYRYAYGFFSHETKPMSASCGGGPVLVEPWAPTRWLALLPLALATVLATAIAIAIAVRRRAPAAMSGPPAAGRPPTRPISDLSN
jgi:hypothetical protein